MLSCTFLPTMVLLKIYVSLGSICLCVYGVVWFRYKKHLVWVRKTCFCLKYLLWSPQTNVKNVETQPWTVVSSFFCLLAEVHQHPLHPIWMSGYLHVKPAWYGTYCRKVNMVHMTRKKKEGISGLQKLWKHFSWQKEPVQHRIVVS